MFTVLPPVTRLLPQLLRVQQRRLHLQEVLLLPLPYESLDGVVERRSLGRPERRARRDRVKLEEVQLLAETAVVPALRLLETVQVLLQLPLLVEGRAVDALEHLTVLIAPPIGAGGRQQLDVLHPPGAGHVGAPAQIQEGAVTVDRDDLVVVELLQALQLEGVVGEKLPGLGLVHPAPLEGVVGLDDLLDLGLEGLQIVRREGLVHLEVVVEPLVDGGAEADACPGTQLPHRRGQDMGCGVSEHR